MTTTTLVGALFASFSVGYVAGALILAYNKFLEKSVP